MVEKIRQPRIPFGTSVTPEFYSRILALRPEFKTRDILTFGVEHAEKIKGGSNVRTESESTGISITDKA